MRIGIDVRKIRDTGIGTYIRNIVTRMVYLDDGSEFILFGYPRDMDYLALPDERVTWVSNSSGKYSVMEHLSLPLQAKRTGVDVFHSPHYTLPLFLSCPSVVTIHDLIHLKFPEYLPTRFHHLYAEWMARAAANRAGIVITVSNHSKEDIVSLLGIDEHRVRVIYNGVEDLLFTDTVASDSEKTCILVVTSPKPHKNLEGAAAAFSLIADRIPYDLMFVGEKPPDDSPVLALVRDKGLEDRVRFPGYLNGTELVKAYDRAFLLLSLSRYEGFGLPIVEAMARGVPVVASNVSSHPEVAGDAAILVGPEDHRGAAEAMMRIITNRKKRDSLIRRGLERAGLFTWETAAERTLACYREVLS